MSLPKEITNIHTEFTDHKIAQSSQNYTKFTTMKFTNRTVSKVHEMYVIKSQEGTADKNLHKMHESHKNKVTVGKIVPRLWIVDIIDHISSSAFETAIFRPFVVFQEAVKS